MSVLNQSGEEQVECPLCMEPLEVDDLNFFPCTCGYQICRFCWHRIRTDENGLCPACRKAYPEDPADFKPLSQEEVARLKAEKRQKDQQRKQKITENRKHLANVRVVQKNLVFVVGLPMRLADAEILKKHDYFGKFGKIHKVVINQSTSYAGSQGPSASAYVTYQKADDALRAIQAVNNIVVDGRTVKTSLGTTKYCSHFMKNQTCPKGDCMYLHELGDPEASFTKEEMQQGKHQEYEKKLHDQLINATLNRKPTPSPPAVIAGQVSSSPPAPQQPTTKEAWPSLQPGQTQPSAVMVPVSTVPASAPQPSPPNTNTQHNSKGKSNNSKSHKKRPQSGEDRKCRENGGVSSSSSSNGTSHTHPQQPPEHTQLHWEQHQHTDSAITVNGDIPPTPHLNNIHPEPSLTGRHRAATLLEPDNNSFFSSNNFSKVLNSNYTTGVSEWPVNGLNHMPDVLPPVHHSEDWQAAFGFPPVQDDHSDLCVRDDDLGFDPFHETQKAFAEMMEKEEPNHQHNFQPKLLAMQHNHHRISTCTKLVDGLRISSSISPRTRLPPPGFTSTPNHMNAFGLGIPRTGSKTLPFMQPTITFPQHTPTQAWDWTALDPAIVTAQHCELFTAPPPPGFPLRQTLDNL